MLRSYLVRSPVERFGEKSHLTTSTNSGSVVQNGSVPSRSPWPKTSRSEEARGSGHNSSVLTALKIAAVAPMLRASVSTAIKVKAGRLADMCAPPLNLIYHSDVTRYLSSNPPLMCACLLQIGCSLGVSLLVRPSQRLSPRRTRLVRISAAF